MSAQRSCIHIRQAAAAAFLLAKAKAQRCNVRLRTVCKHRRNKTESTTQINLASLQRWLTALTNY